SRCAVERFHTDFRRADGEYGDKSERCPHLLFLFVRSQFAEVLFNYITVMGRKLLADLLHGLFSGLFRQVAPARFVADVLLVDVAWPAAAGDAAIRGGSVRSIAAGLTAIAAATSATVGLLFELVNQLVERCDDVVFHFADAFAGVS